MDLQQWTSQADDGDVWFYILLLHVNKGSGVWCKTVIFVGKYLSFSSVLLPENHYPLGIV